VTRSCDRLSVRLAAIAMLAAALGLSACGRKGGLDPPPSASLTQPQAQPEGPRSPADAMLGPAGGREAPQQTPPPKKHFFLDWLLD